MTDQPTPDGETVQIEVDEQVAREMRGILDLEIRQADEPGSTEETMQAMRDAISDAL